MFLPTTLILISEHDNLFPSLIRVHKILRSDLVLDEIQILHVTYTFESHFFIFFRVKISSIQLYYNSYFIVMLLKVDKERRKHYIDEL